MPTRPTTPLDAQSLGPEQVDHIGRRNATVSFRSEFLAGTRAIASILPAAAIVGLVTGVAADAVGLTPLPAMAMSVSVYAPTVMLTAFTLIKSQTPTVVLLVAFLIVAVRFMVLSASITSYFSRLPRRWRWILAYFLWTPVYALSVERFETDPATDRRGYYLGTALPLWIIVQAAEVAGLHFGTAVPARSQLQFVVPLAFIALLVRFLTDRPRQLAAIVAGGLAIVIGDLPSNVGILLAVLGGTTVGIVLASPGMGQ